MTTEAAAALAATIDADLIDTLVRLTHMIHGTKDQTSADNMRASRDLIRTEILLRMGGGR